MHCTNEIIIQRKNGNYQADEAPAEKNTNSSVKVFTIVDLDITPYHQLERAPPTKYLRENEIQISSKNTYQRKEIFKNRSFLDWRVLPWNDKWSRRTYALHPLYSSTKCLAYKIWYNSKKYDSNERQGPGTWFTWFYISCNWSWNILKILEILENPNNVGLKEYIILRMSLHAWGTFLAVIGKRFVSTCHNTLVVEESLLAAETVNQILDDK